MVKRINSFDKFKLGRYVIGFQGFYYFLTGIWALISLSSFEKIVGHFHEGSAFEMHTIAAMSVVLGLFFIYSIKENDWYKKNFNVVYLVIGIALSVIVIELIYLPSMGWNLFWLDLIEEIIIVILLILVIKIRQKRR